jgi:serine/threonine protein kinase
MRPAPACTTEGYHRIMIELTAERLAKRAFDVELLDEQQLRAVWTDIGTTSISLKEFQQFLLRRGLLTSYQLDRLLRGEYSGYFFGEYRVLYQLGSGNFAKAFRAEHRETREPMAIKALREKYAIDPEMAGQFMREGAVGVMLRHDNIARIFEVSSKGDTPYLVMEFLEGRTLRQFLKQRHKLEPPEAVRLMADICAGLAYAAERGISHRDLRPANVMITSRGEAKLLDFGLAAIAHHAELDKIDEGPNARTIDYVGLERVTGVRKNDPRSDIYFAGAILYEMLAGRPPMAETTDRIHRLSTVRYTEVVPLAEIDPDLPQWLTGIVDKAMTLSVERRYQRPSEMLADLLVAAHRLAEGDMPLLSPSAVNTASVGPNRLNGRAGELARKVALSFEKSENAARTKAVMVVEPHPRMQEVFRQAFADSGYQVLLMSDADRAVKNLQNDPSGVDMVVFYASAIGRPAVDAFNRLADDPQTADIPAVLLLGKHQNDWHADARRAPHRAAMSAPLRIRKLRELVARLLAREEASQLG